MGECGECTACCTLFPIGPINKPLNTHCPNCVGNGCSIYNNKPQTCTDFKCAYLEGKNIPKELRPDRCGIIFSKNTDRIFTGAIIQGVKVTNIAKEQIVSFNKQGYSVVLVSVDEKYPRVMLSREHEIDMIMTEYKEVISGNV